MAKDKKLNIKIKTKGAKKSEREIKGVDSKLKSLGKSAMVAAGGFFAARGLINAFKSVIDLAGKQELAETKLEAAIGRTSQTLLDYAKSLQQSTMYGDEATIEAMAMLGAFTDNEEEIKLLTKATLDLAAAKGFDLVSAADLVGKSFGSTTNALTRYGIVVEGAVGGTERLKTLTENTAKLFGGQATAQAKTMAGSIEQMKNAVGDAGEAIGELLSPAVIGVANAVKMMAEGISTLFAWREQFVEMAKDAKLLSDSEFALINLKNQLEDLTRPEIEERLLALGVGVGEYYDKVESGISIMSKSQEQLDFEKQMIDLLLERYQNMPEVLSEGEIAFHKYLETQKEKLKTNEIELAHIERLKEEYPKLAEALGFIVDANDNIGLSEEQKANIQSEFNNRYLEMTQGRFALQQEEINKAVERFREAGIEEVNIATWVANSKKMLDAEILASKLNSVGGLMGAFGQLNTASKGSAKLSKRLAQASAIIDTYAGANKALAQGGMFGFISAAAVIAAGMANVATIEKQKFHSGGLVGGQGDTPIMAQSGEFVLSRSAVQSIGVDTAQRINQGQGAGITVNINAPLVDETVRDSIMPAIQKAQRMGLA